MNKKEIRELNGRLARFEFVDHPETIRIGDELVVAIAQKGGRDYFTEKPLYTNSLDSCLPLLEKLGDTEIEIVVSNFEGKVVGHDVRFSGRDYCSNENLALAFAQAIDKAINELKSEGK